MAQKSRLRTIAAHELDGLEREILCVRHRFAFPGDAGVLSCYEADNTRGATSRSPLLNAGRSTTTFTKVSPTVRGSVPADRKLGGMKRLGRSLALAFTDKVEGSKVPLMISRRGFQTDGCSGKMDLSWG